MDDIPISVLFGAIFVLILFSAFFSSSETAMIALNRYRLRHLVKEGKRSAIVSEKLLERPDRLIGLILLGNNLVNFIAASIATLIGIRLLGDLGVALAPFVLLAVFLIFAEVMPKTLAAIKPETIAFPASYILAPLMKFAYPAVWLINGISNSLLSLIGLNLKEQEDIPLSREELRTIVHEAGTLIPKRHQGMLINILELENVTVDDIMVPRNEVAAINLDDPINEIIDQISHSQHTRLPVYESNADNMIGVLHLRRMTRILNDKNELTKETLKGIMMECYFVPKGTPLHTQMMNFQQYKRRFGIVVDEYGVIQGLVTIEDILEEIVGEFTTDMQAYNLDIQEQDDNYYLIDCSVHLREINRQLKWELPAEGPKTLNGLLLERLEYIPEAGTTLKIDNYLVEITQVSKNSVKMARLKCLEVSLETPED
ncbi:MAG TPA: HlyC/CorC family transporter [Thiotrichaceae bacterium]|nr:HlyC/CorC family transporter [Thiotrichaceae bacterium]HIM08466.1 HlyC/CorC family transporter [Gammaproteobacteria bacterium]